MQHITNDHDICHNIMASAQSCLSSTVTVTKDNQIAGTQLW